MILISGLRENNCSKNICPEPLRMDWIYGWTYTSRTIIVLYFVWLYILVVSPMHPKLAEITTLLQQRQSNHSIDIEIL